jgi:hypothetical protein
MDTLIYWEAELTAVRAAITKALTAQSYGTGEMQLTRVDLTKLERREATCLEKIQQLSAQASGCGTANKVQFNRPS